MQPKSQISKIKQIKPREEGSAVCYYLFTDGDQGHRERTIYIKLLQTQNTGAQAQKTGFLHL